MHPNVGLLQSNIWNFNVDLFRGTFSGSFGSFVTGSNIIKILPSLVFKYVFYRTLQTALQNWYLHLITALEGNIFLAKKIFLSCLEMSFSGSVSGSIWSLEIGLLVYILNKKRKRKAWLVCVFTKEILKLSNIWSLI